jgi:diguanylate cyclase (GGDEF)-like protein
VSFRGRLTLFLFLIVVLPMVVITVLATRVADEASSGKADARLFAGLETATAVYQQAGDEARSAAKPVAADPALAAAVQAEDPGAASQALAPLADSAGLSAAMLAGADGQRLARVGGQPFAAATIELTQGGAQAGTLTASVITPGEYADRVEELTGRTVALYPTGETKATAAGGTTFELPAEGAADVEIEGTEQRVLTAPVEGESGLSIALVGPAEEGGLLASSPAIVAALAGFFLVAFLLALTVMRALSGQVGAMHEAARRIGGGDFSTEVPVVGRDEMAGLAEEFNKMSGRLADQVEQLRRQQVEIDRSVRRIGQAFASGLNRQGLLEIVAETAVSACGADYGLIVLAGGGDPEVSVGSAEGGIAGAVLAAESAATREGELSEQDRAGAHALSAPLKSIGATSESLGVMSVARISGPFSDAERDVFLYLIGQASASIENVSLHEVVSEQAVTDELTGLSNKRAFLDFAHKEAVRAERFGHALSLVMLDIDNFKGVNDTYGHLQGDEVLRRIGTILRQESRGVDEPARYGGEEFVIALPETDPEGAAELAERVRERIEAEPVPFVSGDGVLQITASLGVARLPESAGDVEELIEAADAALYKAKRSGKNRVEIAPDRPATAAGAPG